MKSYIVLFVLFSLLISVFTFPSSSFSSEENSLPVGLQTARQPTDEEKSLFFKVTEQNEYKLKGVEFIHVQTQVVSGTKYFFLVRVKKVYMRVSFVYAPWENKPISEFYIKLLNVKRAVE